MREIEAFATTRIRIGGENGDRFTGNVAAALLTHDTSRALDPHWNGRALKTSRWRVHLLLELALRHKE